MAQGVPLETNAVIDHLRGKIDIAENAPPAEPLFLPLTALGKLYKGVLKSASPEKSRAVSRQMGIPVLPSGHEIRRLDRAR